MLELLMMNMKYKFGAVEFSDVSVKVYESHQYIHIVLRQARRCKVSDEPVVRYEVMKIAYSYFRLKNKFNISQQQRVNNRK